MDRIVLNAALRKISEGKNIEDSVNDAVGVLFNLSNLADSTLQHIEDGRQGSAFLEAELDYRDLERVGNYEGNRIKGKNRLIIYFSCSDHKVDFVFRRKEFSSDGQAKQLVKHMKDRGERDVNLALSNLVDSVVSGKAKSSSEALLGRKARSLDAYELVNVGVTRKVPRKIFKWELPIYRAERRVVYETSKSQ